MRGHYSIDARGLWYACKVLCVLLLLISATRYGIVLAAERLTQGAGQTASAAEPTSTTVTVPQEEPTFVFETPPVPSIEAEAYLVADVDSGRVVASKNADTALPIASITKIVSALVASDEIPGDARITLSAPDRAQTEGTPGRLPANATFEARQLLYPLLMESNNTVAFALARSHSAFVEKMNERAAELGMLSTSFEEPSGLSARNVASARDLFTLLRHLVSSRDDILGISRTASYSLPSAKRAYDIPNFNVFVSDAAFIGGKTGYTDDARQTMAALFSIGGRTIAIVVLGTSDRKRDIDRLREWVSDALAASRP